MRGRLDLTVEALVVENAKWHPLFTEAELAKARARLREYEYTPKSASYDILIASLNNLAASKPDR